MLGKAKACSEWGGGLQLLARQCHSILIGELKVWGTSETTAQDCQVWTFILKDDFAQGTESIQWMKWEVNYKRTGQLHLSKLALSNYIYNPRCQNHPWHFVRILRWSGSTQTKTCFVTFITKLKIEYHMFPSFPFVSSPWRNCHKIGGHHSIENTEYKYPYFCNIFKKL